MSQYNQIFLKKNTHKESLPTPFIELEDDIQQCVWIPQVTYCCRRGVMRVDQDNDVLTLWCLGVVFCFMVTIFTTRSTSEHHRLGNLINPHLSSLQIWKNERTGKGHVKWYFSCPGEADASWRWNHSSITQPRWRAGDKTQQLISWILLKKKARLHLT